jgi:hypothetical protein
LEPCRIKCSGEEDIILNYINYMSHIWLNKLKLTDYSRLGMLYEWIITGQLRECVTPG